MSQMFTPRILRGRPLNLREMRIDVSSEEWAATADLEENLYKEIREETGIERGHIGELRGLGAVLSSTSNVLLVAHAQLRISRAEAAEGFAGRSEPEMAELIAVPETGLRAFLGGLADYRSLIPGLL